MRLLGRAIQASARAVQDEIETVASAVVGVGVIALAALTFVLAVALPIGGLYLLVRFVKWAWMD